MLRLWKVSAASTGIGIGIGTGNDTTSTPPFSNGSPEVEGNGKREEVTQAKARGGRVGTEPNPDSPDRLSRSPVPRIKWRKLDGPQSSKWIGSEPLLQIHHAGFEDEGTYECEAENAKGRDTHQGRIIIHGNAPKHVPDLSGHTQTCP